MMAENRIIRILDKYRKRGGEHAAVAVFCHVETDTKRIWEVHVGNGRCPAVALGEIPGEYIGEGEDLEEAFDDVETKLEG